MEKQTSFHHSVTELGNIQVRQVTEYIKAGGVIDKKYGQPMTPADTKDMLGWDDRSKDIVVAIIDTEVQAAFEAEKLIWSHVIGIEPQEVITWDRVIESYARIAVRQITRIFDEGVEVSKKYHRSWIMPGDDPGGVDVMSKAVAQKLHIPEVIKAYKAKIIENELQQIAIEP